ncbi:CYFA0S02e11122g1_1 [Cyberlindnera fabianii]|uniref:CYFA0S02e11122g1_1 n=1 Tax=Cyberlindnera fabianii TaxID=36022 RepID=A0A061APH3_CYBFA|nr:CYFA0S02e11122g1_1 [Cyberlindnera fabianii]
MHPQTSLLIVVLVAIFALFIPKFSFFQLKLFSTAIVRNNSTIMPTTTTPTSSSPASYLFDSTKSKTPVFFLSHGGPTFMYPDDARGEPGAYRAVSKVGKYIRDTIKPQFVIVVSAHWEGSNAIEIGIPESVKQLFEGGNETLENELIYDFYNFPDYMYQEKFHTRNSIELAEDIRNRLKGQGVNAKTTNRGLDHGVWVPFKVAFSTSKPEGSYWDIDVPLIQVSLKKTEDFDIHRRLGEVLSQYRELGGVVVCSGMSVHNLRELGKALSFDGEALPYVAPFNSLLTKILKKTGEERFNELESLKTEHNTLLRQAHPTIEHFMPIVVAAGAANDEPARELYNSAKLSLGWGVYQFGEYEGGFLKL